MHETKVDRNKGRDKKNKIHHYSERFLKPFSKQSIKNLRKKDIKIWKIQ